MRSLIVLAILLIAASPPPALAGTTCDSTTPWLEAGTAFVMVERQACESEYAGEGWTVEQDWTTTSVTVAEASTGSRARASTLEGNGGTTAGEDVASCGYSGTNLLVASGNSFASVAQGESACEDQFGPTRATTVRRAEFRAGDEASGQVMIVQQRSEGHAGSEPWRTDQTLVFAGPVYLWIDDRGSGDDRECSSWNNVTNERMDHEPALCDAIATALFLA